MLRKSDVFYLSLFCGWIPLFVILPSFKLIDPLIILGLYPVITVPLYLLYKKYDKEEQRRKLV